MIKLVVFDWNGVLIADAAATVKTEAEVFNAFGHKPLDMKTYREIFTMPVRAFFIAAGFSEQEMNEKADDIQALFHQLYEPKIANIRTRSGVRTLLKFLAEHKIECVILSNHNVEGIRSHLKRLRIEPYFSNVHGNHMTTTMHQKNKADRLVELVKNSPFQKAEILIIGDAPEEIEAARAAGIRCVSITGGYYSTRRLKAAKPDFLIHSLPQMIGIMEHL